MPAVPQAAKGTKRHRAAKTATAAPAAAPVKKAKTADAQLQLVSTTDGGVTTLVAMAAVLSPVLGMICHERLTDGHSNITITSVAKNIASLRGRA